MIEREQDIVIERQSVEDDRALLRAVAILAGEVTRVEEFGEGGEAA